MMGEKNSLLVTRIGGLLCQILSDGEALYVVSLGSIRDPGALHRALADVSCVQSGPGAERIPFDEIDIVHIRTGEGRTEISMNTTDGERTWRMNARIPAEAVRSIFGGLNVYLEEFAEEDGCGLREGVEMPEEDIPPVPGGELLLDVGAGALAVLLPALWWIRQSPLLGWANLLFLPLSLLLLARCEGTRFGRFSLPRALWLLPGAALTLMNVRLNLPEPTQILLPSVGIALLAALLYTLMCGAKRRLRKAAVVLILCLLTYAPGAALSVNALGGDSLRISRVTPRFVRSDWIEAPLNGRQQRFYVHPDVCRRLSVNLPCELRLRRGLLGIEYWTVEPGERPNEV